MRRVFAEHRPSAVVNFAAESHVDRSIDGPSAFVQTNLVGTFELLEAARHHAALPRGEPTRFRFLHVSTDEVYGSPRARPAPSRETTPYAPNSPYAASKAGADHLVRAYHHTYGLPALITNCSNNYGPVPVPGEAHPADDPERARGQAAADLRRRRQRARLAATSRTTAAASCAVLARGPARREVQPRRPQRAHQPADRRHALRRCSSASCRPPTTRRSRRAAPARYADLKTFVADRPGPRPALRHRRQQDPARARLGTALRLRAGHPRHGPLVPRSPRLVRGRADRPLPPRAPGRLGTRHVKITATSIPGVVLIEPNVFRDPRGFFLETFHRQKFAAGGLPGDLRPGQSLASRRRAASCAACTHSSTTRRASWCGR